MNRSNDASKTKDGSNRISKPSVLWRDIMIAYAAPALMAGIGGVMIGDQILFIAAFTSIGGTSAVTAWIIGRWLQDWGLHTQWLNRSHLLVIATIFAFLGVATGLLIALVVTELSIYAFSQEIAWLDRVWIDFPLSVTIASTTTVCRWYKATHKHTSNRSV
ncbi:hypothetical protein RQP50_15310 [Paenibacillus sp. chi10]|uniref:Uncharacterized protein n=1 Tax=Paenibacillus suaedae TaxID=3077233 RepID=A0AAJ2JVQ8_9BACL|nr:hypothetical protein [Paenibacillus sp. chi10]MDT8977606.1 hypothetical protein [Paenibacillus sp. chi10]